MSTKKMNNKEWAMYIELQKRNKEMQQKLAKKQNNFNRFRKYLLNSWMIGVLAAIIMFIFFGWKILFETILNWTIGVTIVTTIFAAVTKDTSKKSK